jgi:hypothetical protein
MDPGKKAAKSAGVAALTDRSASSSGGEGCPRRRKRRRAP